MKFLLSATLFACSCFFGLVAHAEITIFSSDEFETGVEGWTKGTRASSPPAWLGTPGWNGENGYLRSESDGAGNSGRQLLWTEDSEWTGNYLSPSNGPAVGGIEYWADNRSGSQTDLELRIAFDGAGGWFVSDAILLRDADPNANEWTRHRFDFATSNFEWIGASGGTGVFTDTLSSVTRLELLHSPGLPQFQSRGDLLRGPAIASDLRLDGFRAFSAVPEPSAFGFGSLALIGYCLRRRSRNA
ncbi:MAG: PEP-CTERM sorting domain-containing protein [Planctomycetota bacterium]